MALYAIKESKLPAVLCRLSPPGSPSKRRNSHIAARGGSKFLVAFDAMMAAERRTTENTTAPSAAISDKPATSKKATHPFFLASGASGLQPAALAIGSKPKATTKLQPLTLHSAVSKAKKSNGKATTSDTRTRSKGLVQPTDPTLPLYTYEGYSPAPAVVYTRHEDEANELAAALTGPLGFDMEWRIFIQRGAPIIERRTAVVQLSDARMILVVQVSQMKKFPQKIKELIESPTVVKTGANIRNDGEKLFRDYGIVAANLVELGALAHRADPAFSTIYHRSIVSLARMVEHYTRRRLDKGKVRIGNWEAAPLSQEQITYAANDAHCALVVYKRLIEIATEHGLCLDSVAYACSIKGVRAGKGVPESSANDHGGGVTTSSSTEAPSDASKHPSSPWLRPPGYVTNVDGNQAPRPQHLRAYKLWQDGNMPLPEICAALRSKENPLAESTVISYVVRALQADSRLPFSMDQLKAFVQLEAGSWQRHREWIMQQDSHTRQ